MRHTLRLRQPLNLWNEQSKQISRPSVDDDFFSARRRFILIQFFIRRLLAPSLADRELRINYYRSVMITKEAEKEEKN